MDGQTRPRLLLHPAVVPAKWLLLADILARLTDEEADRQIEGAEHLAWAAGWLPAECGPTQVRVLGQALEVLTSPRERIGDTLDTWSLEDTIARSYNRHEVGYWVRAL